MMVKGGCFCGFIRYEAPDEPFDETNCHCSICRRTTGAPFITWLSVRRSSLRFLSGTPTVFKSTTKGTRRFCPRCGTHLTFEDADYPGSVDLSTCSLDDPESLPPKYHIHTNSKLTWIKLADGLPEYRERRDVAPRQDGGER